MFGNTFQINMGHKNSHDVDIESKGVGVLDIHKDAHVLAYLQTSEISVGLTSKEHDQVVHKAK
jgi:hypothetical protein